MLGTILILVGIILLALVVFLLYSGFFYSYTIRCAMPASLPRRLAYKVVSDKSEARSSLSELSNYLPQLTPFTVYYDNPDEVQSDKLRAIVGCSLPEDKNNKCEKSLTEAGYDIEAFPQCTKALITEFPYRNFLSLKIAVSRVYPSLMEYIREYSSKIKHYGPFVEICKPDSIQFVVVLEPSEGFTVSKLPPQLENFKETKKTQ